MKRIPKIVRKRPEKRPIRETKKELYEERHPKTQKEEIVACIERCCTAHTWFMDYGLPYLGPEEIEEVSEADGIYICRFRCRPFDLDGYFIPIAKDVIAQVGSRFRLIQEYKVEYNIPFYECAWILQVGEIPIWRRIFMSSKKQDIESKPSPRKCSHQRWDDFLQTHYNRSLVSVAEELGYSEQNLDLLKCDATDATAKKSVYKKHRRLFDSFLKDEWNKALVDGRNVLDYFKDLIASWIGEDLLVKALNEYGFTASLANADSDRIIKTERRKVTGEPDIKIEYEGNTRYMELMDALSPVEKFGQFDLRLSKAKNQFNHKSLFLLHGLADNKFVLIDFMRENITVTYNYPNPRFGNKPCSVVRFEDNNIKMQDMIFLWESIRGLMLNTNPEPIHTLKLVDFQTGACDTLGWTENDDMSEELDASEDSESEDASTEEETQAQDSSSEISAPVIESVEEIHHQEDVSAQPEADELSKVEEEAESVVDDTSAEEEIQEPADEKESIGLIGESVEPIIEFSEEQWSSLADAL